MKRINNVIAYSSTFILVYWTFCLVFLRNYRVYHDNFEILDLCDTIVVALSFVHAFFHYFEYLPVQRKSIIAMMAIIAITAIYPYITTSFYTWLYMYVIVSFVVLSIKDSLANG